LHGSRQDCCVASSAKATAAVEFFSTLPGFDGCFLPACEADAPPSGCAPEIPKPTCAVSQEAPVARLAKTVQCRATLAPATDRSMTLAQLCRKCNCLLSDGAADVRAATAALSLYGQY